MLIITPGPVPADGTRIKIAEEMTAFVQGTNITSFGNDEFAGAPIDFVISATDPPATSARTRATLWFARGEGKLYRWTLEPQKSAFWSPSEAASNTGSEGHWLSLSNRRDMLVKCRWGWGAGEKIRTNTAQSEWKFEQSIGMPDEPRFTLVCSSTSGTEGTAGTGEGFTESIFMTQAAHIDPSFVSLQDGLDGQYLPVCDMGFVDVKVRGPGANGIEPMFGWHVDTDDPHYRLTATGVSAMTNTAAVLACIAESAASSAEQLLQVLFYASSTNMVKPVPGSDLFNG